MGIRSTNSIQSFFDDFFEAQVTCSMTDVWAVRYQKGDQQTIHNHKSWGFTGILYVDFDPKVHTPTGINTATAQVYFCPTESLFSTLTMSIMHLLLAQYQLV